MSSLFSVKATPLRDKPKDGCEGDYTNWGHCKLKLTQIKLHHIHVFEERGKPEYPRENLSEKEKRINKLNPHMTPNLRSNPPPGHHSSPTML